MGYAGAAAIGLVGPGAGSVSGERVARVLAERGTWIGLGWSLWVAAAATIVAAAAASVAALLFRTSSAADRLGRAMAVAPLPVPPLVAAATALLILGQSGVLARLLAATGVIGAPAEMAAIVYDRAGIGLIAALAWKEFPFLALLGISVLATRGDALEETARSLGAAPGQVLRHVTWPLLWRGLLPGAAAVFVFAFGSYETAALLAPSDPLALPLLIEERAADPALDRRADAYVLALLAVAVAALLVAAHEWLRARPDMTPR